LGLCCGDLDLDRGLGDEGVEGSKGLKGLRLARGLLSPLGDVGWRSLDVGACEEDRCVCLLTVFFLLTCSHLFSSSSLFSFSFYFIFCTSICKMTIFVTYLAFERNLFIIQLLYVCPLVHFDFDSF